MVRRLQFLVLLLCLGIGRLSPAQLAPDGYATPAHVSAVQGGATIVRGSQADAPLRALGLRRARLVLDPEAARGPAWVSWGLATDYVSWCPLGWDDGPVFGVSFGFAAGSRYSAWLG
jgi:hypothetical protein